MKQNFCAALILAAALSASAAANPAAAATAPAKPAMTATNGKPADVMTQLFGDPVIAKGKGFEIKQSQLDEVVSGLKAAAAARGQAVPPEQLTALEAQMLDRLIQIQLLLQKATDADKAEGKKKADVQVAAYIQKAGSQAKFDEQLKAVGITSDDLRAKVTQELTAMVALQRELGVTVSDADVMAYYTNHPADFEEPEKVHVRHILLLTENPATQGPLPDDQIKAKRKQIDDILKRARGGEDFAKLATEYSEDPGSKDNGGELPPFARASADPYHAMVPPFEAAAFSLTNNQISDVVTTTYGYHIIKLLDKVPAHKLALTDKPPGGDMTLSEYVKNSLAQQKMSLIAPAYLEKLTKAAGVEILDSKLKAATPSSGTSASPVTP